MSLRRCRTPRCPEWTREGYGDNPYMEADGVFCWRCRQKDKRAQEKDKRARRAYERRIKEASGGK